MNEHNANQLDLRKLEWVLRKVIIFGIALPFLLLFSVIWFGPDYDQETILANVPPFPFDIESDSLGEWLFLGGMAVSLIIHLPSLAAVYFFKAWARKVYFYSLVGALVLYAFSSQPSLCYPHEDFLDIIFYISSGIVICLLYFTPLREKFIPGK